MEQTGTFLYVKFDESKDSYGQMSAFADTFGNFRKGNCGKLGAAGMAEKTETASMRQKQ